MPRRLSKGRTETTEIVTGPRGRGALMAAEGLERPQATALEAIILGKSMQEAADAAGVDRATLYRWRVGDPRFMRALAEWRQEIAGALYDRLAGLGAAAAEAVQAAIEAGDGRLAFRLLHGLRAMQPPAAPQEQRETHAVAFKRWLLTIHNPGAGPEEVEAFVMERFGLDRRDAGNITYRRFTIKCPLERPTADALLRELNGLGAYVSMRDIDVVRMAEDLPSGYQPGPIESFPPGAGPPAFFNAPPHHPGIDAHFAKLRKRREELEALDAEEEEQEREGRRQDDKSVDK